jgi:oligopeptide transport system ATP-binding protein
MSVQQKKILSVQDLKVYFDIYPPNSMPWTKPRKLKAVDGVSFDLFAGETLGIVGESGCGKSTLARAVIKMVPAEAGKVMWLGKDLISASKKAMLNARRDLQMIFQDPLASLNPRMTIGDIIAEPLRTHHPKISAEKRKQKVKEMMAKVGLLPNQINRYPHEFSGGQCQRIGIARALILKPKLIICDEPVSALDVSIQAQIVNLLMDLQREMGLSLIFIAHDLSIVQHISTRVMVLYLGNVCEITTSKQLYAKPRHPYTQALISAVPIPDPEIEKDKKIILLEGDLPSPINPPSGCVFRTRCPKAQAKCSEMKPPLEDVGNVHEVACFYPG